MSTLGYVSRLRAGDSSFTFKVAGHDYLTVDAITSTDAAVNAGQNTFNTAGQNATEALESGALTLSDIDNRASYEADSTSVGLSAGQGGAGLSGIGVGRDDGDASSTTLAAISGLAGDQDARTGDAETGIAPIFDADQVKQDVQAQAEITQAFGSQASQLAQNLGDSERAEQLNAQADQLQQAWGDTGKLRLAAHTAIGALTGGTAGASGAAVGTLSAAAVADALNSAGVDGPLADSLIALASTAAGAATGGTQGGAAAFNEVVNNYLSHDQLSTARDELAACEGDSSCMADVVERYQATSQQQDEAATDACATDLAACQEHSLAAADGEYARYGDDALWDLPNEALPYMLSLFDENIGVQNAFGEATIARLLNEGGISPEMAVVLAAMPVGYNKTGSNRTIQVDTSNAVRGTPDYELLNNPPANSHVRLDNGTEFKTGVGGYVEEVTYRPIDNPGVRDSRQTSVGKEGLAGDVGGHIQACRHGGTCDRFNLFPQNSNFNSGAYKRWENEITRSLQNGEEVGNVTVRFDRADPYNPRPDSLEVEYQVNGRIFTREFLNQAGG